MEKKKLSNQKKKKEPKAYLKYFDDRKENAPKGEIIRIFPRYTKLPKGKKVAVLIKASEWINSEFKRLCK